MSATAAARTTARRRTLRVAAAALVAAAGLSLTACSGSDTGGSKAAGNTGANAAVAGSNSSDSSKSASGRSALEGAGAQAGNTKSGSDEGASAGTGNGGGTFKSCSTDDLTMEAVDSSPDDNTGDVTVQMTNKSGATCSATGFAGADIKDADGTSAPVRRADNQPRITNLQPGDTATFNISYDVDHSGDSLAQPTNILVTPPNGTHSVSLKWPANALKLAGPYDEKIQLHPVGLAN
ncbi:DUF4232 domain-containing protein [Streptomyces varsoviensis]|uniref:Glycine-rich secreted protein n=1 Tax=Streptomyces varsoviensis TaxID=67373 RepID=A0ABR5JET2_9ACTN|nr:DUF4232 domain-containing protein [Streptomyces varsoviensis]KOG91969.1 glycine-rich secreted protein [Streptomyces varsoviensis]